MNTTVGKFRIEFWLRKLDGWYEKHGFIAVPPATMTDWRRELESEVSKIRGEGQLYRVRTVESELHEYVYHVRASSKEEAEELVRSGSVEYSYERFLEGEMSNVFVKEISEEEGEKNE